MSANTKASGIVKKVYVKDGDIVRKGDKILEIDLDFQGRQKNAAAWSSYLLAKNSLESAKATQLTLQADMFSKWDTFKELAESSTYEDINSATRNLPEFHIPQKEWLAAEAKYKNQEAVIAQAQASINNSWLEYQLTSSIITAPTDGTITSLMFTDGMSIGSLDTGNTSSNQKVATVETQGTPIVSVNLSEIDVSKVQIGQKATITLDSISDKTFTGVVTGVDRIGTTTSNVTQYPSIIKLDSNSNQILPNMSVTANIIISSKNDVLLVPSSAVQTQDGVSAVEVLQNGQIRYIPVEIGLTSDSQSEIISGLEEGEVVVTGNITSSSQNQNGGANSPFTRTGGGVFRMGR
jgi:RND family efflux transporter MFP subunit